MENTAGTDPTNETGETKLNANYMRRGTVKIKQEVTSTQRLRLRHMSLTLGHGNTRQTGEKKQTGQEKGSRHENKQ